MDSQSCYERMVLLPRKKRIVQRNTNTASAKEDEGRETVVMFVDIMGASEVSNHMTTSSYAGFVQSFQSLFIDTCTAYRNRLCSDYVNFVQFSARGDEGLLMIYRPSERSSLSVDVDIAVNIALDLKRRWLFSKENKKRIETGLLPIDLAVGVHTGKTYLTRAEPTLNNPGGYQPEGYAINLAKRVEGHSREGRSSHIFLSEAAHGTWNTLPDERTYFFDEPLTVRPKGISREIRVYELKHHFLPSDWTLLSQESERARTFLDPELVHLDILVKAIKINPTNLWLNEEFIRSSMLVNYYKLSAKERTNNAALKKAFEHAWERADLMAQSEQRDSVVLCIQGLIEGEFGDYISEREKYDIAIKLPDQLPEALWYKAQSLSEDVKEKLKGDTTVPKNEIQDEKILSMIDETLSCFDRAKAGRFQAAWFRFDYGSEMVRWATTKEGREGGIEEVVNACILLPEVRSSIQAEPYLESVLSDPRIKAELDRA